MDVPENLYNQGEVYNLSIGRGTLTEEERFKINDHIAQTIIMLEQLPFPKHLARVPEYAGGHHEKMDEDHAPTEKRRPGPLIVSSWEHHANADPVEKCEHNTQEDTEHVSRDATILVAAIHTKDLTHLRWWRWSAFAWIMMMSASAKTSDTQYWTVSISKTTKISGQMTKLLVNWVG